MKNINARITLEEIDVRGNVVWSVTASEAPGVFSDFSTTAASAIATASRVVNHAVEAEYQRRTSAA